MKLQDAGIAHFNTVTAYVPGRIDINQQPYTKSMLLTPTKLESPWHIERFDELTADFLTDIASKKPEVVLIGTGVKQRFLSPQLAQVLWQHHIGVESMDTAAACRTYNILMSEERKVMALMFFE